MLSIEIRPTQGFGEDLVDLSARQRRKADQELDRLADLLYTKVIENLSGKVLQSKTGELKGSISKEVYHSGYEFIAFVGPVPATAKAFALEYGGKDYYMIYPSKAQVLAWIADDGDYVFAKRVAHPPSKEYAYLRSALEEVREELDATKFIATFEDKL